MGTEVRVREEKRRGNPDFSKPAIITVTWTRREATVSGMTGWEPLRTGEVPIGVFRLPGIRLTPRLHPSP
jgi:hypothetical protein